VKRSVPNLKRGRPSREPKRRFFLFTEGKNTEPDYFDELKRRCGDALIAIEIVGDAGVPRTIAETAIKHAAKRGRKKRDSYEENDQVWAVFDRDAHPFVKESVAFCKGKGVKVALSTPCFEIWLVLHFESYDKPDDGHVVQKYLESLDPTYDSKKRKIANSRDILDRLETAEQRAETQLKNRESEGMPFGPPSTTVFYLTRAIRKAAAEHRPATGGSSEKDACPQKSAPGKPLPNR
jgi:hypothetical protein